MSIFEELDKNLDPKYVATRTGRGSFRLSYIEGHHAIREANRIFGFDGWYKRIAELKQVQCEQRINDKDVELWYIGYTCSGGVGAHVGDRERMVEDVGFGQGIDRDPGTAHESAVKEAVTDMMKRCLKDFGDPFGLALYDKAKAHVGNDEVEPAVEKKAAPRSTKLLNDLGLTPTSPVVKELKKKFPDNKWRECVDAYDDIAKDSEDGPSPAGLAEFMEAFECERVAPTT